MNYENLIKRCVELELDSIVKGESLKDRISRIVILVCSSKQEDHNELLARALRAEKQLKECEEESQILKFNVVKQIDEANLRAIMAEKRVMELEWSLKNL